MRGGHKTPGRWRGALLRALGKLPGLLAGRPGVESRTRGAGGAFERERQTATLDRFSGEPGAAVKTAVEDALERLRGETKTPRS